MLSVITAHSGMCGWPEILLVLHLLNLRMPEMLKMQSVDLMAGRFVGEERESKCQTVKLVVAVIEDLLHVLVEGLSILMIVVTSVEIVDIMPETAIDISEEEGAGHVADQGAVHVTAVVVLGARPDRGAVPATAPALVRFPTNEAGLAATIATQDLDHAADPPQNKTVDLEDKIKKDPYMRYTDFGFVICNVSIIFFT